MEVRITVLAENSVVVPFDVIGEHGFAAFVETPEFNFLFDTGQGKALVNNAIALKKDLSSIKFLYLSHGHYDHTGGMVDLLKIKSPLKVYTHKDAFSKRFWFKGGIKKYIGIPFDKKYLESLGAEFVYEKEFREIEKGIFSSGEVERKTDFEKIDAEMKVEKENGELVQDQIWDDFSLAIDTSKGLIVILGCAHAGIVNILNHFINKTGKKEIYAVIGGTHLGFANDEQINATLDIIEKYNIQKLGASHCTGLTVSAKLYNKLKDKFFFAGVGSVLEV
ncbi:MBL fold metallo-hydrolase [Hippea maritima]|uniref:Beta-lactamase domain protein n=1 Tax=Hippea maritima (strain ATCC 700847 / DSM 10411 / MH2) TaxID=760142 RepID=F2LUQ9_HIPMA|nr:MBL fold metallo-hydrolase [Hippea maritima]AEA33514.1 beta-lactamase domain protein [Hippea maritima DSM 10411]